MARRRRVVVAVMLVLACLAYGQAQDQPPLDLKDPGAVAQAYLKACREADLEGALALLSPDEPGIEALRPQFPQVQGQMRTDGQGAANLYLDLVVEMALVPLGVPLDQQAGEAALEGDLARVKVRAAISLEGSLVLARQADGTWRVKLIDSIRASTKSGESMLAQQFGRSGSGPAASAPTQEPWASVRQLREIYQALQEYAGEHAGRLPPAARWVDEVEPYLLDTKVLKCPATPDLEYGYALNEDLSGQVLQGDWETGQRTLLLFEWPGGERNARARAADVKSARADGTIVGLTKTGEEVVLPAGITLERRAEAQQSLNDCNSHLNELAQAARRYARAHDGMLPPADGWEEALAPYASPQRAYRGSSGQDRYQSENRLRLLYRAAEEYSKEHDGNWPPAERWMDELEPYLLDPTAFVCPSKPDLQYAYAMNDELSGQKVGQDWQARRSVLLFFEWPTGDRNAHATPDALAETKSFRADGSSGAVVGNGDTIFVGAGEYLADRLEDDRLSNTCQQHLDKLGEAARRHAREHEGVLPSADSWMADLAPYLVGAAGEPAEELFTCPAAPGLDFAYAINRDIAGKKASEVASQERVVVFFESDLNVPNAAGNPGTDAAHLGRHLPWWQQERDVRSNITCGLTGSVEFVQVPAADPEPDAGPLAALLTCPAAPGLRHAYAINAEVAGKRMADLVNADTTVLFFESDLDAPNAAGTPSKDAPPDGRHLIADLNPPAKQNMCAYLRGYTGQLPPRAVAAVPVPAP